MRWIIATLLFFSSLATADNITVPKNYAGTQGEPYLKSNDAKIYKIALCQTTDNVGNVIPCFSALGPNATVNQGNANNGVSPWHVIDNAWIADFDAWKIWANVNLSTRASEATLSSFQSANHTDLLSVQTKQDAQITQLTAINTNTDDLEARVGATNETAAASDISTSGLNGLTKRVNQHLTLIEGYTDGLETLVTSSNTKIDTANSNLVTIQGKQDLQTTQLTAINSNTDGLEALATAGNASLASIDTKVSTAINQTNGAQKTQLVDATNAVVGPVQTLSGTNYAPVVLAASAESGSALVPRSIQIAGSDGTNARTISTDTTGRVNTNIGNTTGAADFSYGAGGSQTLRIINVGYEGTRPTYSAAASGFTVAAAATDIFTITGSASKTIKVTRMSVTCSTTAGSGILARVQLIKRSTANTAGTSVNLIEVPHDSTFAAATATTLSYTANPTLGTAVGTIRAERAAFASTGLISSRINWEFGTRGTKPIVLNGTSQVLAINLNATTVTGGICSADTEWVEE